MRRSAIRLVLLAALTAGFVAISTAQSDGGRDQGRGQGRAPTVAKEHKASAAASARVKPPMPYSRMTLQQRARYQERALQTYLSRWHFWVNYRSRYLSGSGSIQMTRCRGVRAPAWACWSLEASIWTKRELAKTQAVIEYQHEYAWQLWLPDKWARIGACETGGHVRPGRWDWANSRFLSAFGISIREYDNDAAYMGVPGWPKTSRGQIDYSHHPTPWQEYQAARGHEARFGMGGWGCRNA